LPRAPFLRLWREAQRRMPVSGGLLMPKATAVWLVENTSLSFDQIAAFCSLHPLEVKGIADGEVAAGIKGADPISNGQLSREEIDRAQKDPTARLKLSPPKVKLPEMKRSKRGPRYTPVSRRQDRPNAILWLLRNHPELKDAQIMRLVGTTKTTIQQIRERTHWNSASLSPLDPVTLGLCSQIDLDMEVQHSAKDRPATPPPEAGGQTLMPTDQSLAPQPPSFGDYEAPRKREGTEKIDADSVFAKLKDIKRAGDDEDED
jgi:uncharacterized protein